MSKNILQQKWGDKSLALGWTTIPTSLLFLQKDLLISANGMNVLLHLVMHWWKPEQNPHPSQKAIAERMGVSVRTVQRALYELENHNIISKQTTKKEHPIYRGRNIYDLSPLISILESLVPDLQSALERKKNINKE